jgi:hypothetical protein
MSLEFSFYVRLYSDIYLQNTPRYKYIIIKRNAKMNMEDIPTGETWACRFKTTTFIDKESGVAVEDKNLAVGAAHRGIPGEYEGIGLIQLGISIPVSYNY